MRGPSIRLWLRTFLVFWEGGRLWEVVAHGRWLQVEVRLYLQEKFLSFLRKLHKHLVSQMMRKWACTKSVLPACTGVTQSSNRGPERSRLRWLTRRVGVHSVVASAHCCYDKIIIPFKVNMVKNIKLLSHKLSGIERKNLTTSKVINIVTPKACAFINLV